MKFTLNIKPQPKGRPRTVMIHGKPRILTPKKTRDYEKELKQMVKHCWFNELNQLTICKNNAVSLSIIFEFVRPVSVKREFHTVKSDLDNYCKSLLDSMNGIIYVDDAQVNRLYAEKRYGEFNRIIIEVL